MQPRVTAILVARNGAEFLPRTLAALGRQLRRPDSLVLVDDASTDATSSLLAQAAPTQLVRTESALSVGSAVSHALRVAVPEGTEDDWLWLLTHDSAPEAAALQALVGAVEIAPSVAVAGPKLMRWDEPGTIAGYGETITRFGSSVALVVDELDQAQHDRDSDRLAVAASGMLVRRSVFAALGGFDPSLSSIDAALDFCVRVRLAGHRVIGVPAARVASAGPPESFGRSTSTGTTARIARAAQLHRRLVWSAAILVPLHWLSILPLAIIRSIGHLLGKRPGSIAGELHAGLAALVDTRVAAARRNLARNRSVRFGAIAPLRLPWRQVRQLRQHQRDTHSQPVFDGTARIRPGFLTGGGAWIVILLAVTGAVAFSSFVSAAAVVGGGLAPLDSSVAGLWNDVGFGWREIGAGFVGAADPFAAVVAILGSIAFWAPSSGVVLLYLAALPLAGLAAWWCAARFSERGWAPAFAAILWALAPPFLSSLSTGHLGAVVTHLLLPWLVLAFVGASRSWSSSAAAALLFAAVAASSPVLVPVLFVGWIAWIVANPRRAHRLMAVPIPTVLLFVPLLIDQGARGNWLGLLADPGVPSVAGTTSGWQLALGSANGGSSGWAAIATALGIPEWSGAVAVAVLLVPLAILALVALYLPGSRRSIPALVVALAGFVVAVASAHLWVTVVDSTVTSIWPGSGLSVFWLGLVGAATFAITALGRRAVVLPVLAATIAAFVLAAPALGSVITGSAAIAGSSGRTLPAYVTAEAASSTRTGTLELRPQANGGLEATLERGVGTTLDEQSTVDATDISLSDADRELATLAGNLASRSGFDSAAELKRLGVSFVLLPTGATDDGIVTRARAAEALDANSALAPIGSTLWRVTGAKAPGDAAPLRAAETALGVTTRIALAIVFGVVLLLAIPTSRRRRARVAADSDNAATTFDEDTDD